MLLFFILIVLISVNYAFAITCPDDPNCVCEKTPDYASGLGQVLINSQYFSCDNNKDYVCPEDFQDAINSKIIGNCSACIDPDCTGTVNGTVKNLLGIPIPYAIVTSRPIKWDPDALSLETQSAMTGADGKYSLIAPTGTYYVSASAEGFDTELIEVSILRWKTTENINFALANGTCHEDCTNYYGRCNSACEETTFENDEKCKFYNSDVKQLCNNKLKETTVYYGENLTSPDDQALFVDCCEGEPYSKYYYSKGTKTNQIDNLIKIEKLVRYNDVPVKLVVAYWR